MTSPIPDASVYSDLGGLAALKRDAHASDPNALRQVARQFESIFAKMMLTSMRQASFGDSIFNSDQTQFYQGMFDDQLSLELTKGRGLGLADLLVRQLQHLTGGSPTGSAEQATKSPEGLKLPGRTASTSWLDAGASSAPKDLKLPAKTTELRLDSPTARAGAPHATSETNSASAHAGARSGTAEAPRVPTRPSDLLPFLSGEPFESNEADAFNAVTGFVTKLLSGNAEANANASSPEPPTSVSTFRTPSSPEDFVQQLWPCAEQAGRELGVNPAHLLAQAALETGWGKSLPCDANGNPSFNFFGIKSGGEWQGGSVSVRTLEFEGGIPVPKQARFRSYDSAADSFRDYVALLRDNPRYAAALNTGDDAKAFATALQRGGYATDPAYAQKITAIAQNLASSATALKSGADQPIPYMPDTP
jgi:flagellar protein FlgJ